MDRFGLILCHSVALKTKNTAERVQHSLPDDPNAQSQVKNSYFLDKQVNQDSYEEEYIFLLPWETLCIQLSAKREIYRFKLQ